MKLLNQKIQKSCPNQSSHRNLLNLHPLLHRIHIGVTIRQATVQLARRQLWRWHYHQRRHTFRRRRGFRYRGTLCHHRQLHSIRGRLPYGQLREGHVQRHIVSVSNRRVQVAEVLAFRVGLASFRFPPPLVPDGCKDYNVEDKQEASNSDGNA